jgi:hypothetical protein
VKRSRELIYTAERQASRDVSLAGLRLKPGSSQKPELSLINNLYMLVFNVLDIRAFFLVNYVLKGL